MDPASIALALARNWRICLLAALLAFGAVQTARLHHAKADLASARAALIDPATKKTWQSEAEARGRELTACQGNFANADAAVKRPTPRWTP